MFVVPPRTSSTRQPTGECAVEKTELRDKQQQQLTERWAGRVEINKKKKWKLIGGVPLLAAAAAAWQIYLGCYSNMDTRVVFWRYYTYMAV